MIWTLNFVLGCTYIIYSTYSIFSPKLTIKSWNSMSEVVNLYTLSKLGGRGRKGNLDKIQKKAFFLRRTSLSRRVQLRVKNMNIWKLHFKRKIQSWLLLGTPLKGKCGLLFESLDFMAPVSGDCEFCTSSGLGAGSTLRCRYIGRGFTIGPVWKYPCSLFIPWSDYILSILTDLDLPPITDFPKVGHLR